MVLVVAASAVVGVTLSFGFGWLTSPAHDLPAACRAVEEAEKDPNLKNHKAPGLYVMAKLDGVIQGSLTRRFFEDVIRLDSQRMNAERRQAYESFVRWTMGTWSCPGLERWLFR